MSQHDMDIANQGFPAFRSDLNNALQALASASSGTSAPSTTYANMLWYDTTNDILKIRNEDDDAWISILKLDQTNDDIDTLYLRTKLGLSADNTADLGDSSNALKDIYMQGNLYFDNDNSYTQKHYTWVPLSTAAASASSSIDITIPSGYDVFRLRFQEVYPATDGTDFLVRTSQDGGSSFDAGSGNYVYTRIINATTFSANTVNNSTSSTAMRICDSVGNTALESVQGYMDIYDPLSTTSPTKIYSTVIFDEAATTNKLRTEISSGRRANAAHATDAIRIIAATGNITAGNFVLYGKTLI